MDELPDEAGTPAQLARGGERQLRSTALASAGGRAKESEPNLGNKRRAAREGGEGRAAKSRRRGRATSGATQKKKKGRQRW